MVMQARIISSSLKNSTDLNLDSNSLIENLNREVTSRIRVISNSGDLLVDSSRRDIEGQENIRSEYKTIESSVDDNFLYKMVRFPLNFVRYILRMLKTTVQI